MKPGPPRQNPEPVDIRCHKCDKTLPTASAYLHHLQDCPKRMPE
jgi:hypothetical protein